MAIVSMNELLKVAKEGGYAVGYFESWNLESTRISCGPEASSRSLMQEGLQLNPMEGYCQRVYKSISTPLPWQTRA